MDNATGTVGCVYCFLFGYGIIIYLIFCALKYRDYRDDIEIYYSLK